jgi:hypothetical protein
MLKQVRLWFLIAMAAVMLIVAGYAVPRSVKKGGDMLDAVAAVQRRCPIYLTAERDRPHAWVTHGGIYLSRTSMTAEELDYLLKDSRTDDARWDGVVYFKANGRHPARMLSFLPAPGDRALD